MSLVICSNQEKDGTTLRQNQSIYNAWSFRNPLSSTMTIPANSQVALQSCKVNIDGRVAFSSNNNKFYHYFGDKLSYDSVEMADSTSHPVLTTLTNDNDRDEVVELSVDDFANRIQERIRTTTYHPNCKEQFLCDPLRNASGLDFLGYKFTHVQNSTNVNSVPPNNDFVNFYDDNVENAFTYTGGVFTRTLDGEEEGCCGIAPSKPFSLTNGSFIVDVANCNASDVEWSIGLSRKVNLVDGDGFYYPDYFDNTGDDDLDQKEDCFVDFGVGRNELNQLIVFQTGFRDGYNSTFKQEIQYWNNTNGSFQGATRAVIDDGYTKYGFFSNGEVISVKAFTKGAWHLITEYNAVQSATTYFKPVNQSCWCLHPVLCIGTDASGNDDSNTLTIDEFSSVSLTDYDATTIYKGGWYETMEQLNKTDWCFDVEQRTWNDPTTNTRIYKTTNASGGVNASFVMILNQSNLYSPSDGANAKQILGFNQSIVQTPNSGEDTNTNVYESTIVPSLSSSLSMFVKLNNFGQNVMNAFNGNKSKILAHLTDLETSTGRQTYEPKNIIWLDLDNPGPLQVNEFDISFSYINEQYATILTGQSIVALYFRKKPKELM